MENDRKISQLPVITSLTGEEIVPFARNETNGSFRARILLDMIPERRDLLYVPTLNAVPDSTVTSYKDSSGKTVPFVIGQLCRVADSDSEQGYAFYLLYDLSTGGKAVWSQIGGGADLREKVRISLTSNQTQPDDSLIGATVVVTDTTLDEEVLNTTWQGQELLAKVTPLSAYTITVGDVDGYATPAEQDFAASIRGERNVSFVYNACLLTVQITGLVGDETANATVAYGSVSNTVENGGSLKVPYGVQVTVSCPKINGYVTPQPQIVAANQASRNIAMTYVYNPIKYSYVTLNQTVTDPATMLSGDINGEAVQLIRRNSHRVLGKQTGAGKMTYCRLKDDDGTKYHDGTAADLTGTEGDVFMLLPKFYWKVTEESTDVYKLGLAYGGKPDDTWKEWDGKTLIGVYEAFRNSGRLYSRSGVVPITNVAQAQFKVDARNGGAGYMIVDWSMHCMMAMLYYCQYGHMNSQLKIGRGTSSYPKTTGATDALCMTDTVAGGNGDSGSINFFGLENWWGDIIEWMEGIEVNSGIATITNPDGSTRTVQGYDMQGYYPKKMVLGEFFDLIGKELGAGDTSGYCDYFYLNVSQTARVVRRSYYASYTYGGVACALAHYDASYASSSIGSRLAFRGDLVEAESVAAFKAIPVTN